MKEEPVEEEEVEHEYVTFVDDSNSVVEFNDPETANEYIKKYFNLLTLFYNSNELKINDEKTNLLAVHKPNKKRQADNIVLRTDKEPVTPKEQVRILGWLVNKRMDMETNINKVVKQVNNMIHLGNGVSKYMINKSTMIFARSFML